MIATGGSQGIGRALCIEFAKEGADCVVVGHSNLKLTKQVAIDLFDPTYPKNPEELANRASLETMPLSFYKEMSNKKTIKEKNHARRDA